GSIANPIQVPYFINGFTTYACNPNFFMECYPPGAQSGAPAVWVNSNPLQNYTFSLSNVVNPTQKIAIGDASQILANGYAGYGILGWWQNAYSPLQTASMEDLVSSQGFTPGWNLNTDYPSLGYPWQLYASGLRFRHGQTNANDNGGWANAVFFDGHASRIPVNQLPAGMPVSTITGTSGLRVLNVVNPTLSPNAEQ
ncbi:MAG: hypothetical protein ACYCUV_08050, partial [Phycisphaerae bacterium]